MNNISKIVIVLICINKLRK